MPLTPEARWSRSRFAVRKATSNFASFRHRGSTVVGIDHFPFHTCWHTSPTKPSRHIRRIPIRPTRASTPMKRTLLAWRRKRDSNPRNPFEFNGFQDRRLKPLGHSSIRYRIGFRRSPKRSSSRAVSGRSLNSMVSSRRSPKTGSHRVCRFAIECQNDADFTPPGE